MTGRPRPLTLADLPRVLELEHTLFGPSAWTEGMLREELTGAHRHYIAVDAPRAGADPATGSSAVAESSGPGGPETELVGYAGTWFDGRDGRDVDIMTLAVAPSHQGRGLGRVLLDALLAHERERGAERVFLEVRVDNELAIAMYERSGFERLAVRRGYYQPENVDALSMRLVL